MKVFINANTNGVWVKPTQTVENWTNLVIQFPAGVKARLAEVVKTKTIIWDFDPQTNSVVERTSKEGNLYRVLEITEQMLGDWLASLSITERVSASAETSALLDKFLPSTHEQSDDKPPF